MALSKTDISKSTKVNQLFDHYFAVKNSKRSLVDIFLWWERRRIVFNAIILSLYYLSFKIEEITVPNSEALFTQRELFLFIIGYNILYSSFCVLEFFIKENKKFAPIVFKNALFINIGFVTVPTVFHLLQNIGF